MRSQPNRPDLPPRTPGTGAGARAEACAEASRQAFDLPAILLLTLSLLLALLALPAVGQETAAPVERPATEATAETAPPAEAALTGRYNGVLVDLGNVLPRDFASRITIHLDRLTPPEDLDRLGALLQQKGQEALRDELADREVGRVQVDQGLGYPIAAALTTDSEDGMRHLVLLIARPLSIGEVVRGSRLRSYPFSVIELDLEPQGYGSGEMTVAASIARLSDDRVVLDQYPIHPLRIVRVRQSSR